MLPATLIEIRTMRCVYPDSGIARGFCFALILAGACFSKAQQSPEARTDSPQAGTESKQTSAQHGAVGGMSNAGPHAASFDSQHRPITAGGFVKTGPIVFQDIAAAAGLTHWHHQAGTSAKRLIL
jgi:hypothetical protein